MSFDSDLKEFLSRYKPRAIQQIDIKKLETDDTVALQLIRSLMSFYEMLYSRSVSTEDALWYLATAIIIGSTGEWCKDGMDVQEEEIVALLIRYTEQIDDVRYKRYKGSR